MFTSQTSMALLKMLFGNAIFMALCFVWHVTEMTGAVDSYAGQAVYRLADLARANMSRLELAVRSSNPKWYLEGMQLSAYNATNRRWRKRRLTWAVTKDSSSVTEDKVDEAMRTAFDKWTVATGIFKFENPSFDEQPDIRIKFEPLPPPSLSTVNFFTTDNNIIDDAGVDMIISDMANWTNEDDPEWCNLQFVALAAIGRVLGLAKSTNPLSILYISGNKGAVSPDNPVIAEDDILGVKFMYPDPPEVQSQPPTGKGIIHRLGEKLCLNCTNGGVIPRKKIDSTAEQKNHAK